MERVIPLAGESGGPRILRSSEIPATGMERLWSPAVATSGNRWQMREPRKRLEQAKTVATGCDQLPIGAHGRALQKRRKSALFLRYRFAQAPVCSGYGAVYRAFRMRERRLDGGGGRSIKAAATFGPHQPQGSAAPAVGPPGCPACSRARSHVQRPHHRGRCLVRLDRPVGCGS